MIKSLYVHIPFCLRKCLYCDFNSYSGMIDLQDDYIDSLIKELENIKQKNFNTIFVGGGTPTILSLKNLDKLLKVLYDFKPNEFTFESNPGTLNNEKLSLLKEYGVNRLSIGLQAWQDRILKNLGRIHSLKDFLIQYEEARKVGFKNINIDLMFAVPGQTMEDLIETIKNTVNLNPEHISCYSLIIEENTPFYDMYKEGSLKLPNEELERDMYHYVLSYLNEMGYFQYEISNFSRKGFECSHNITYWRCEEYYGAGAGAHSYVNGERFNNVYGIKEYINGIKNGNFVEGINKIDYDEAMEEFMFMGLRMLKGISRGDFIERFNRSLDKVYGDVIHELTEKGLLLDNKDSIYLSKKGLDLANQVFYRFLR